MYSFLRQSFETNQILMAGMLTTFLLTFLLLKHPFPFLPSDHGRAFAVNGALSKGKLRGVGLTFVLCFLTGSFLFLPVDREYVIYAVLLFSMMLSGYLDDASDKPWNEYLKGLIDLVIAIMTAITFLNFNDTAIRIGSLELGIPVPCSWGRFPGVCPAVWGEPAGICAGRLFVYRRSVGLSLF